MRMRTLAALAVSATTASCLGVAVTPAFAAPSTTLVVNEAYGGGGNSGATLKNDFIELANRGTGAVSLQGYSVQYLSASPSATTKWSVTPLTGSVDGGSRYLIGEAAGSGGTQDLPATRATGSINMSASSGTVALVRSTDPLSCMTAAACASDPNVVDLVGYGSAVVHEGSADAPGAANTTSVQRTSTPDTDQNGTDFTVGAPTPGAPNDSTTGGGETGTGTPGPLRIHDITSTSWISPQNGKQVTNVPGIVTGIRSSGSTKGYWIQDPTADDNQVTSEGIFIYTGSMPTVTVGDSVLVSGKVSNYYPLGSGESVSSTSNLSALEIGSSTAIVLSRGNPLPAPVVITPTTVPDSYAPDLGGANIEQTPITPSRSALDYWRSVQGMRVQVNDVRVVGPSNKYGEQYVTTKPTQAPSYRGGTVLLGENQTPSGRLQVVSNSGLNPQVNVGDTLSGATIGEVDYSMYGGFFVSADTLGAVTRGGLQPVVATPSRNKQLTVATYNVENLAPTDSDSKFAALGSGVVTNLASPDVVALEEVQDNSGSKDDGTVAADQTLAKLTAAIKAAGGPSYDYRQVNPVNDKDGGQPGGNIRTVFLFNPARVSFVDSGAAGADRSTTATQVIKSKGKPALTLSPGRIDPTNGVWTDSRKPLVGQFRFRGKNVFVIANHFNSKGGDQNADGRFQYPKQVSATQRAGQASVEHRFVDQILAVDKKASVVVVGDLNDYQFSPALNILRTGNAAGLGKPNLTDLITTLPVNQQYTYDYQGISQVLDHILVTPRGFKGVNYQVVHINAEFANQTSDHDPQVVGVTS